MQTELEHSSIYGPLNYLMDQGFEVSFESLMPDGKVDLENLKSLMREDTILVSINAVNSELGIVQPIEKIVEIIKEFPKCHFHVDMTQMIGKRKVDCSDIDLVSFSAHKFYGLKGIGVLIKKEKVELEPLIHGGKSTTKYRSGTRIDIRRRISYGYRETFVKWYNLFTITLFKYIAVFNLDTVIGAF